MRRRRIISAIFAGCSANSPRSASVGSTRPWWRPAAETHPLMKALARAKAYVAYAQAQPGMYGLMFRTERLDMTRPSLHEAATASFEGLASAVGAGRKEPTGEALEGLSLDQAAAIARAWSLVHGFTTLLLDGRLKDILHRLPEGTGSSSFWTPCCVPLRRDRRGLDAARMEAGFASGRAQFSYCAEKPGPKQRRLQAKARRVEPVLTAVRHGLT